jgi:uncharacterized protein (TIGR03067 family)
MRRIAILGAMVAVLALCRSTRAADDDIKGTYTIIGIEAGGEKIPDEFLKKGKEEDLTLKITADKIIAIKNGKEDPAAYKLDTSKKPHEIDLTATKDGKEEKMYGIFKVDGDKLIICMAEVEKPADRPKEFKTTKEGKSIMITLQKKK